MKWYRNFAFLFQKAEKAFFTAENSKKEQKTL
jgi:hypothetical protein